jgi:hypothetical protein
MVEVFNPDDVILSAREITARVEEYRATAAQIEELRARQDEIASWLGLVAKLIGDERAKVLIGDLGWVEQKRPAETRRTRSGEVTWTSFIEDYVTSVNRPVDYPELREAISKSVLGPRLAASDKSFYASLQKLADRRVIVRKEGWVFSPSAYDDYVKKVAAGEIEELAPSSNRGSRIGHEIMKFISSRPEGVSARDIVEHMKGIDEFRGPVERNSTSVYNPLAKLVRREEVRKEGTTYYPLSSGNENGGSQGDAAA